MRAFIRVGDRTTHGGTVITGDPTWRVHGKLVARVGDLVVCRKCRGTFAIRTGAEDMTSQGQAVARDGDVTDCGATLLASLPISGWSDGSAPAENAASDASPLPSASSPIAPEPPTLCFSCLAQAAAAGATLVVRG